MFEQNSNIIIVIVLLFFIVWNYQTPIVEGFPKFNIKKLVKSATKSVTKSAGVVIAAGATAASRATSPNDPSPNDPSPNDPSPNDPSPNDPSPNVPSPNVPSPNVPSPNVPSPSVPDAVNVAATSSPMPDEIQAYLDKIKTYSSDAVKMSDSVKDIATNFSKAYDEASNNLTNLTETTSIKSETAVKQISDIQTKINKKANEIQVQINSNNIVKNEIQNLKNEMKDIQKNVSTNFIDVKELTMQAKEAAEKSTQALAGILPTKSNNTVNSRISVEGFSGFNTELEGYTVFSQPTAGLNAFDIEKILVEKLNLFNKAYYDYMSNKNNTNLSALTTANANLQDEITKLSAYIGGQPASVSDDDFSSQHAVIKSKASEIESLRADLDMKMQEILKAKEGIPTDYSIDRDTTAYTGILWTALATSLLYFVFVEME